MTRIRSVISAAGGALVAVAALASASAAMGASLPHGVPAPTGSKVLHVTRNSIEVAYTVSVANESSAYEYWMKALPAAGFKVDKQESSSKAGKGQIWFSGNGYKSPGTLINIYKNRAIVNLER